MIDRNKLYYNANVEIQVNILKEVRFKIKSKNKTFEQYLKNGRKTTDFEIVNCEAAELSEIIQNRKEKFF